MPAPYRRLGRISKAHGTQGEVSVAPRDDLSFSRLGDIDVWIVPPPASGAMPRRITAARPGPKGELVRISGIDTAPEAYELAGRWLIARGDELQEVAGDTDSFVGLNVEDETRGPIGVVAEVIVTGANDVLVVEGGTYGEVLIPVIDQVILGVDGARGVLRVALLDGLIEEDE